MSHHGNHLPPSEVATKFELSIEEVLRFCDQQSIPVIHGRIDHTLFGACLSAHPPAGLAA